jgi:hypothetical protein
MLVCSKPAAFATITRKANLPLQETQRMEVLAMAPLAFPAFFKLSDNIASRD